MESSLLDILERACKARSISIRYEERREHPRVPLRQPARLLMSDGSRLDVTATSISRDAMQITCERNCGHRLRSSRFGPPDGKPLMVVVSVQLPVKTGVSALTAVCEVFPRDSGEDGGELFALRFFQFDEDTRDILDTFITQSLPAG